MDPRAATASNGAGPDVVVVGAGAAGLMTAIWIGRSAPGASILVLDGARTLGAKILVAGGGRCNVTHHAVDERAYAGSTRPAIRKVLQRFPVEATIRFFAELGVTLKREETGKLFPTTDRARTVLDALLDAARAVQVEIRHPLRVERVQAVGSGQSGASASGRGFLLTTSDGTLYTPRLVLATGGMALPKSGSDGAGYGFLRDLDHSVTEPVFPALVPLLLPDGHPFRDLAGIACEAEVRLVAKGLPRGVSDDARTRDAVLLTHFGLSGPAILDISRHWTLARQFDPAAHIVMSVFPDTTPEQLDQDLASGRFATPMQLCRGALPERLIRTLCAMAGVEAGANLRQLPRAARQRLARTFTALRLDPSGDRGYSHAEVTAGGLPLAELALDRMESRRHAGLWVVGELCDVDGRIGGFNFQWAWASGFVAGSACGAAIAASRDHGGRTNMVTVDPPLGDAPADDDARESLRDLQERPPRTPM